MSASRGRRARPGARTTDSAVMSRRRDPGHELAQVATTMRRLAVLLSAGLTPVRAWQLVAEQGHPVAAVVAASDDPVDALLRASAGMPARARSGWRGLAALWAVATETGAPLAAALEEVARGILANAEAEREIAAALAGPTASARLVLALPPGAVILSALLGLGALEVLVGSPFGWACVLIATVLVAIGHRWSRRLIVRASTGESAPGLDCELTAVALAGGLSADRAVRAVLEALARTGIPGRPDQVGEVLDLCARAGAPASELLRAEAAELRRAARAAGRVSASVLAVQLMLPLGLCVLPAFVVVGVVPILVGVISSTVGTVQ